jgi:hypothetical protein
VGLSFHYYEGPQKIYFFPWRRLFWRYVTIALSRLKKLLFLPFLDSHSPKIKRMKLDLQIEKKDIENFKCRE